MALKNKKSERHNEAEGEHTNFFSIIIPAHNEEKFIGKTLGHVRELLYDKNSFEVLVVENGSTDDTAKIAGSYAGGNVRVLSSKKGVSRAKNSGLEKISNKSDWVIFLDADTVLEKMFLKELNEYLNLRKSDNLAVGTTAVYPIENKNWYARGWFWFYNIGHKFTKTSFAIQIMKTSLREKVRFDIEKSYTEDLQFIQDLLVFGKFFYVDTDMVLTSTRRFEAVGWVTLFIKWNWDALVWRFSGKTKEYPVIR